MKTYSELATENNTLRLQLQDHKDMISAVVRGITSGAEVVKVPLNRAFIVRLKLAARLPLTVDEMQLQRIK